MAERNREATSEQGSDPPDATDDWIAGHLRRVRNEALREDIPERMRALTDHLDRLDEPEEEDPP